MKTVETFESQITNGGWEHIGQHPSIAGPITVLRDEITGSVARLTEDGVMRAHSEPEFIETLGIWVDVNIDYPAIKGFAQISKIADEISSGYQKASSRPNRTQDGDFNGYSKKECSKYTPEGLPGVTIKSFDLAARHSASTHFYALGRLARLNSRLTQDGDITLPNPLALIKTPGRPSAVFAQESQTAEELRGWDDETKNDRRIVMGRILEILDPSDRLFVRSPNPNGFTRDDETGKLYAEDQPSYWSPVTRMAVSAGNLAARLSDLSGATRDLQKDLV
jgi:hypothetical protein